MVLARHPDIAGSNFAEMETVNSVFESKVDDRLHRCGIGDPRILAFVGLPLLKRLESFVDFEAIVWVRKSQKIQ